MAEEKAKPEEIGEQVAQENIKDYASKRLVELKNSEQQFVNNVNQATVALEQQKANLIACRARISEVELLIRGEQVPPPTKA